MTRASYSHDRNPRFACSSKRAKVPPNRSFVRSSFHRSIVRSSTVDAFVRFDGRERVTSKSPPHIARAFACGTPRWRKRPWERTRQNHPPCQAPRRSPTMTTRDRRRRAIGRSVGRSSTARGRVPLSHDSSRDDPSRTIDRARARRHRANLGSIAMAIEMDFSIDTIASRGRDDGTQRRTHSGARVSVRERERVCVRDRESSSDSSRDRGGVRGASVVRCDGEGMGKRGGVG